MWMSKDSGIRDAPLSEKGKSQAFRMREKICGLDFDLVICSPLTRAVMTMQIGLADRKIPTIITPLIRERCDRLADMGQGYSKLKIMYPDYKLEHFGDEYWWHGGHADLPPCPHESQDLVRKRAEEFKKYLKSLKEDKVLIVSHGNFIRAFLNQQVMKLNCSITEVSLSSLF